MIYATPENSNIGDTVLIPINGEFMHDEQFCIEYEVVLALKAKVKPEDQIVGDKQEPLPEYFLFQDEIAYKQ